MSEGNIKKMAELLRNGATMLDEYCPKCGNILFRLKSQQLYCPSCNVEIRYSDQNDIEQSQSYQKLETAQTTNDDTFKDVKQVYTEIFTRITNEIKNVKEISRLKQLLEVQNEILELIKKVRDLTE